MATAIVPWLGLVGGAVWGSRVVQVMVWSHWSGLRESSKSVPVSRVSPRAASPVVQLGHWSVFKVSRLDHLGSGSHHHLWWEHGESQVLSGVGFCLLYSMNELYCFTCLR